MACGGRSDLFQDGPFENEDTKDVCRTLISGTWFKTKTLVEERYNHHAWLSPLGIILFSGDSSEFVDSFGGQSSEGFSLRYDLEGYCSIQLEDKVIMTSGSRALAYNQDGWIRSENYPPMNHQRTHHGCGHYINSDNVLVLLVTGGYNGLWVTVSTTEILVTGSDSWKEVGNLPVPMLSPKGVSIENKVIMTGGGAKFGLFQHDAVTSVLSFNITDEQWYFIGDMNQKRVYHGISFVPVESIIDQLNC